MEVNYNMLFLKITLWGVNAMVKNLTLQCEVEKFKSPHLQFKLPRVFRWLK